VNYLKKIRIKTLNKMKRIQQEWRKVKGRAAARFQELVLEAQSYLDSIQDGQLKLGFRYR
jgi:hypothetical protein